MTQSIIPLFSVPILYQYDSGRVLTSENLSTDPRRLIGFNSFVKGKFGNFNYCSDLVIA